MTKFLKNFTLDESGAETMEYIAIVAAAIVLIGVVTHVSGKLQTKTHGAEKRIDSELAVMGN